MKLLKHYTLRFSALSAIGLSIRSIYDHVAKDALCAKVVTGASSTSLSKVAEYWTRRNNRREADAQAGLTFVREVLQCCAIPISTASKSKCILSRRVALLKAYADREGAHISLQHYEFTPVDMAHVVAATALVGAVIHHFDHPGDTGAALLARLDPAAHSSALEVLPQSKKVFRLFEDHDLELMIRNLLHGRMRGGAEYLCAWLPSALGLEAPPAEFFAPMAKGHDQSR